MKIELSPEQLQVVVQALEQGPFRLVAPVLAHLQREIETARGDATSPASAPGADGGIVDARASGAL